jgi:hypothetical protein
MKAVIQRCLSASVTGERSHWLTSSLTSLTLTSPRSRLQVDNQVISSISQGLLVLIGINKDDTLTDSTLLVKKILGLRLFDSVDENQEGGAGGAGEAVQAGGNEYRSKAWKRNVMDIDGEILCGQYKPPSRRRSPPHSFGLRIIICVKEFPLTNHVLSHARRYHLTIPQHLYQPDNSNFS